MAFCDPAAAQAAVKRRRGAAYDSRIVSIRSNGAPVFVGRRAELAAIAASTDAAEGGRMQVVWIEGEAGSGKTALVREALHGVGDRFTTLWSEADELSMDASYSLVSQFAPVETASPFAAGMALVDRLGAMQANGPVALVAEDLQWADAASRGALLTAARRLHDDQVVMVLTSRPVPVTDDWERFRADPERCRRLDLGGLGDGDVGDLASRHGVELTPDQTRRLRDHTDGHPLHVRTLLSELSANQLRSATGSLPAPRSLAATTLGALAGLSADAKALAAALAVLGMRTPLALVGTVAEVEDPTGALEPLLATGLVQWWPAEEGTPVAYSHPLHRAAVYDGLAPRRRRALHRAAAQVTSWGPAWAHRVAAADSSDDALADELEAGAQYEVARQDLAQAATYLSWAATLTSTRGRSEDRLLLAARLLVIDGQTAKAAALHPRIVGCRRTGLRDLVLGMLALAQAEAPESERWLLQVVESPDGAERWVRADALGRLGLIYVLFGRGDDAATRAKAAIDLGPTGDPHIERIAWWTYAMGAAMASGAPTGLARLAPRLPGPPGEIAGADAELLVVRGMLRMLAGATIGGALDLRTAVALARRGFGFEQLPRAHIALSRALYFAGEWDEALVQARNALELIDDHRVWMHGQPEGALAPILAARGQLDVAEECANTAIREAEEVATMESLTGARVALAAVAQARGDHRRVVEALQPLISGHDVRSIAPLTLLAWWPTMIRATIAAGDLERPAAQIDQLEATCADQGLDGGVHLADLRARLAAARGDGEAATAGFATALERLGPDHPWLDRALLHYAYGQTLRARGSRRSARDQLRIAYEMLDLVGARPYREAVAREIAEWEGRTHEAPASRADHALTSREQDVVALVRKGYTNREVGAQLYISAKAVAYHLGNVYGKLGITSRRALRDMVLS